MATRRRRLARVVAVVAIAAAAGHFMQAGTPDRAASAAAVRPAPAAAPAPMVASASMSGARAADLVPPAPPEIAHAPLFAAAAAVPTPPLAIAAGIGGRFAAALARDTRPAAVPVSVTAAAPETSLPSLRAAAAADEAVPGCIEALDVAAAPGGMLVLALTAPCRADARVVLRHGGLAVTGRTTIAGTLAAVLPAFDPAGAVTVQFDDGRRVTAAAAVPDLGGLTRFGVQWMGDDAFHLHGFAGDAGYGAPGHVSAGMPGGPAGHVVTLGDPAVDRPLLAEVYTFPADRSAVRLDLEAPLNADTCGREMLGETLQWSDGTLTLRDLSVPMPDCGEGDGYLVLQNPLADLTLAAN
ncbi:MAG: hypothetical protein ACK4TB_00435 [Gemmobacter sp.]